MDILTVDLLNAAIILGDGTRVPVSNWIDAQGDDVEDPRQAVSCVGQLPDGNWLCCQVLPGDRQVATTQ